MVLFWEKPPMPVYAAMLGQSGGSSKVNPLGYRTEPINAFTLKYSIT